MREEQKRRRRPSLRSANDQQIILWSAKLIDSLQNGKPIIVESESKLTLSLQTSLCGTPHAELVCTIKCEFSQKVMSENTLGIGSKMMNIAIHRKARKRLDLKH
jgi:hypothetical protein